MSPDTDSPPVPQKLVIAGAQEMPAGGREMTTLLQAPPSYKMAPVYTWLQVEIWKSPLASSHSPNPNHQHVSTSRMHLRSFQHLPPRLPPPYSKPTPSPSAYPLTRAPQGSACFYSCLLSNPFNITKSHKTLSYFPFARRLSSLLELASACFFNVTVSSSWACSVLSKTRILACQAHGHLLAQECQ